MSHTISPKQLLETADYLKIKVGPNIKKYTVNVLSIQTLTYESAVEIWAENERDAEAIAGRAAFFYSVIENENLKSEPTSSGVTTEGCEAQPEPFSTEEQAQMQAALSIKVVCNDPNQMGLNLGEL